MPSLYAHYLFGQTVRTMLPERLQQIIRKGEKPFNLGLQGPDFFFYGSVLRDQLALQFGEKMHNTPLRETLERMTRGLHVQFGKAKGGLTDYELAYLIGFVGHFSLDSSCHPYIFKIQQTEANHLALETDFDNYLLRQEGKQPHKVRLYKYCCPADAVTRMTAVKVYSDYADEMPSERVEDSVKDLRMLRHIMRTPSACRLRLVRGIMENKGIYESRRGMLTPPPTEENPLSIRWAEKPEDAIPELERRFKEAQPFYKENVSALMGVLEKGDPWPESFEKDFS